MRSDEQARELRDDVKKLIEALAEDLSNKGVRFYFAIEVESKEHYIGAGAATPEVAYLMRVQEGLVAKAYELNTRSVRAFNTN